MDNIDDNNKELNGPDVSTEKGELSFESALRELEAVTTKLERGQLSLEESIQLFNTGVRLSAFCQDKLNEAKQKISQLLPESDDGTEIPFEGRQSEYKD